MDNPTMYKSFSKKSPNTPNMHEVTEFSGHTEEYSDGK